jgi:hypothetical protein
MPPTFLPAMANHLWQSTIFVLAAGLLTLAFRKDQSRTERKSQRHGVSVSLCIKPQSCYNGPPAPK